jgi:hypothetical protein
MAEKAIIGTIDTTIPLLSCSIDSTSPGWPTSSLVPVFNRIGGPCAASVSDGLPLQHALSSPLFTSIEVTEVIGQEELSSRDGLQRGKRMQSILADHKVDRSASAQRPSFPPQNQEEYPPVGVEVRSIPNRGGRRRQPERYPFSSINVARKVNGGLEGESFFIPDCDLPQRHIAVARKRYGPGRKFETRRADGGVLVWRKS